MSRPGEVSQGVNRRVTKEKVVGEMARGGAGTRKEALGGVDGGPASEVADREDQAGERTTRTLEGGPASEVVDRAAQEGGRTPEGRGIPEIDVDSPTRAFFIGPRLQETCRRAPRCSG